MDSLAVLGNVLEEFMDLAPKEGTLEYDDWREKRERVERALEENGLRYYRFGRVLPQGDVQPLETFNTAAGRQAAPSKPARVEELLEVMVRGLRRAMHPSHSSSKGHPAAFVRQRILCPGPVARASAALDQRHQTRGVHAKLCRFEHPYGLLAAYAPHSHRNQDCA